MRAIPGIGQFLYPLEKTVRNKFIPAIIGGHTAPIMNDE